MSPNATRAEVVSKVIYLRQSYHFGPLKIAMYLTPRLNGKVERSHRIDQERSPTGCSKGS